MGLCHQLTWCNSLLVLAMMQFAAGNHTSRPAHSEDWQTGPCDETHKGDGVNYTGCQNKSWSGRTCQKWMLHTPHSHGLCCSGHNDPNGHNWTHNYCRNPDGEKSAWCYTTDPARRWEHCDPLGEDFQAIKCEKTQCKAESDALKAAGLRGDCAIQRDIALWSDVSKCCQYMKPLGECAEKCCSNECGDFASKIGSDVDLDFHYRFSNQFCRCRDECPDATMVAFQALTSGKDPLKLSMEIAQQKAAHPLMKLACSDSGWKCFLLSAQCSRLLSITGGVSKHGLKGKDLTDALALLGTLAWSNCPGWNKSLPAAGTTPYVSSHTCAAPATTCGATQKSTTGTSAGTTGTTGTAGTTGTSGSTTTTFTGTLTLSVSGATKAQMETATKASLAAHFGVAASGITVTATESRRLSEARQLSGSWSIAYTLTVPTSQAAAVETKVTETKTSSDAMKTVLQTQLATAGVAKEKVDAMKMSGFTSTKTPSGASGSTSSTDASGDKPRSLWLIAIAALLYLMNL